MVLSSSTCCGRSRIFFPEKHVVLPAGFLCPFRGGTVFHWDLCLYLHQIRGCESSPRLEWHGSPMGLQLIGHTVRSARLEPVRDPTSNSMQLTLSQRLVQRNGIFPENFLNCMETFNSALIIHLLNPSARVSENGACRRAHDCSLPTERKCYSPQTWHLVW